MVAAVGTPKIRAYYEQILADFSIDDVTHTLHYLLKILENLQRVESNRTAKWMVSTTLQCRRQLTTRDLASRSSEGPASLPLPLFLDLKCI